MKKIILSAVCLLALGFASVAKASTEEVRYWEYVISCLQELQSGGVMNGKICKSDEVNPTAIGFTEKFVGGTAKAGVNCDVGWYRGSMTWDTLSRESLFLSQYMDETYLRAGHQVMPFLMSVNSNRTIEIEFAGVLPSDSDEVWFNGVRAWREGNVWKAGVYKPWNVIGETVEVVWTGHGGWHLPVGYGSFGGKVVLNTGDMDKGLLAPTQLKAVSFLADSRLQDGMVKCLRQYYSSELGCQVLEFKSAFEADVQEFTVVLCGYDQSAQRMVNYYSGSLQKVNGTFCIPLGDTWVKPMTSVRVYCTDPRTGDYVWSDLDNDLWYDVPSVGTAGKGE